MKVYRASPEPNDRFSYMRKGSSNKMSRNDSIMKKAEKFINCYSDIDMLKPARTRDTSPQVNLKHLLIKNNVSIRAKS